MDFWHKRDVKVPQEVGDWASKLAKEEASRSTHDDETALFVSADEAAGEILDLLKLRRTSPRVRAIASIIKRVDPWPF